MICGLQISWSVDFEETLLKHLKIRLKILYIKQLLCGIHLQIKE